MPDNFESKYQIVPPSGCWIWTAATNRHGYGLFGVNYRCRLAHRVSWERNRGPIPDGICVLHKCDVPSCVNPDHLFLGTRQDNVADMYKKGRGVKVKAPNNSGVRNGQSKLSDKAVMEIRALAGTISQRQIAERYGVHQSHICKIIKGDRWHTE